MKPTTWYCYVSAHFYYFHDILQLSWHSEVSLVWFAKQAFKYRYSGYSCTNKIIVRAVGNTVVYLLAACRKWRDSVLFKEVALCWSFIAFWWMKTNASNAWSHSRLISSIMYATCAWRHCIKYDSPWFMYMSFGFDVMGIII